MQDTPGSSQDGIDRRRFLSAVGGAAGAGLLASAGAGAAAAQQGAGYVLQQGDRCFPVTPLSGTQPVEEFYDYRGEDGQYSAHGMMDLQRQDTSLLFLYEGPRGVSLVVVHDRYRNWQAGGSVTFRFSGLPQGGQWVIRDDDYDADTNYDRWNVEGANGSVDWTWGEGRTDGGVFRGLSEGVDLRIDPAFNEEAALHGRYNQGRLSEWQVLSGSRRNPQRRSLDLSQPIRLFSGTCSGGPTGAGGTTRSDGTASGTDGRGTGSNRGGSGATRTPGSRGAGGDGDIDWSDVDLPKREEIAKFADRVGEFVADVVQFLRRTARSLGLSL